LRAYHKIRFGIPFTGSPFFRYDDELGWKGKKVFGDPSSKRYKIFFVGDSFTYGSGVDEDKMYYRVAGDILNAEVFAYGGLAYGTLQEYIVIDKFIDEIKPDLVVLQISCGNDFINNLWELDVASFVSNSLITRPYLIDGRIEYRFPRRWGKTRISLATHSRVFYFIFNRMDRISSALAHGGRLYNVEEDIKERGADLANFRESVVVTGKIIEKMKARAGGIPIVVFAADDYQPYLGEFRKICAANGIMFIDRVPEAIDRAYTEGIDLFLRKGDMHWNDKGHEICGKVLAEELTGVLQVMLHEKKV